jgi:hypothetical protein
MRKELEKQHKFDCSSSDEEVWEAQEEEHKLKLGAEDHIKNIEYKE